MRYRATNTFAFPESSDFEDDDEIDINGDSTGQDQTDLIPYETRIRSEASLHAEAQTKNAAIFIRNKSPVAKQEGVISMVSQDLLSAHDKKTETLGVDSQWSKKLETTVQKTETASSFLKDEREKLAHDLDSHSSENLSKPIWKKEMSATIGSDHDDHPQKYTEYFLPKFESKTKFNYTFGRTEDFDLLGQESQIVNLSEDESDIQSSQGYLKTSGEGHENSIETETPSKDGCISLVAYNQEYTKNRMRQSIDWYDPTHDSIAVVKKRAMHSPIKEDLNPLRLSNESVVSEFEDRESTMINPRSSMTAPLEQHHDTRVEVCNGNTSKELWGDELGEKSGKTAYFRAREFNKAKFHSMGCFPDDTGSSHKSNLRQVLRQASLAFNDPKLSSEENLVHKSSATIREHSNQNAISTSNRCALNKKAKYQNLITEGTDQASEKIDTTDTNNSLGKATIPTNGSHSDNEVHDHVKTEMRASASENHKKRKAEVITEIINEDQCPRANPFPTFHHKISSNFENNLRQEENPPATDVAIFSRPSKRQKVFEKLGYVALGGFATAVGLFSALVATAPDFE